MSEEVNIDVIVSSLRKRLSYMAECLSEKFDPSLRDTLDSELQKCRDWVGLKNVLIHIQDLNIDSPFSWYSADMLRNDSPCMNLKLKNHEISNSKYNDIPAGLLSITTAQSAFRWGQQALLSWAYWAPHLDTEIFTMLFQGTWKPERENSDVNTLVDKLLIDTLGKALVLSYYSGSAYVMDYAILRQSWKDLFLGIDDLLILSIKPQPALWAICYFHHNYLEVGKLAKDWIHPVVWD